MKNLHWAQKPLFQVILEMEHTYKEMINECI